MAGSASQARPHASGIRRLAALLAAAAAPGTAHAGAWITADGGRAITTLGYRQDGPVRGYETDTYVETPLNERFAVVGHAYYAQDTTGLVQDEADVSLKTRIFSSGRLAAAGQAGVTWRSEPEAGCGRTGGEVRALVGASSRAGGQFLNVEGAYRTDGRCPHARYEATWGIKPRQDWLLLAQGFVDDDLAFGETLKIQATAVRFGRSGRGFQLSVRGRVDGGDVIEPTIILGYWSATRRR